MESDQWELIISGTQISVVYHLLAVALAKNHFQWDTQDWLCTTDYCVALEDAWNWNYNMVKLSLCSDFGTSIFISSASQPALQAKENVTEQITNPAPANGPGNGNYFRIRSQEIISRRIRERGKRNMSGNGSNQQLSRNKTGISLRRLKAPWEQHCQTNRKS